MKIQRGFVLRAIILRSRISRHNPPPVRTFATAGLLATALILSAGRLRGDDLKDVAKIYQPRLQSNLTQNIVAFWYPKTMDEKNGGYILNHDINGKLKPGAPFLIYLYYALDNRPWWYRAIWRLSNLFRLMISSLPPRLRLIVSQIIAVAVYWPLARLSALVERAGYSPAAIPLESYRDRKLYVMRTDAYDRFCTRLEQRFTRQQIEQMLTSAGFGQIRFSDQVPYWCAVGKKR